MRGLTFYLLIIMLTISPPMLNALIIHVPADSSTIQGGINGAVNGDTVMVSPGIYNEWGINFLGKAIVVMSTDPFNDAVVAATIVDGNHQNSVFIFESGEELTSVLAGFTIRNGRYRIGGGVRCWNGSGTVTRNVITENFAELSGGGVATNFSHAEVTHNQITKNFSPEGAGIRIYEAQSIITNNVISENTGVHIVGGGIWVSGYSTPIISENTITNNSGWLGGGIFVEFASDIIVTNTILWGNTVTGLGSQIYMVSDPELEENNVLSISYSNLEGGILGGTYRAPWDVLNWGEGMVDIPPEFTNDGYHLTADSPMRNIGDPDFTGQSQKDIDNERRIIEGQVDIGADEIKVMHIREDNPPAVDHIKQSKNLD
jgi:hypothetical protein